MKSKVTALGGGTGTYIVLSGLKQYSLDLAAIVAMTDSGGSTGRLRDQLEVLPPGDLRQCLVALSNASDVWRQLFLYRFDNGDLRGHNFGNIFLSALEKVSSDYQEVIDSVNKVLDVQGEVIPVTFEQAHLCVTYQNGITLKQEGTIDEDNYEESRIKNAFLEPSVGANPKALQRIKESDYIIIGPGDLYTSIIPIFLTEGVANALAQTKATIIYVMNLMTKVGQTTHYKAKDFIADIRQYTNRDPDMVIVNSGIIPEKIISWYQEHMEEIVTNNLSPHDGVIIERDIIDRTVVVKSNSDALTRSILRHDSAKLAHTLLECMGGKR